jgi:hypothetical protein
MPAIVFLLSLFPVVKTSVVRGSWRNSFTPEETEKSGTWHCKPQ